MAISYDDVKVGDEIPSFSIQLDQMMLWITPASGDLIPSIMTRSSARRPDSAHIAHGLSVWVACRRPWWTDEDPGRLRKLKAKGPRRAGRGDTVTFKGKVVDKKEESEEAGRPGGHAETRTAQVLTMAAVRALIGVRPLLRWQRLTP
jgi:hypothetical protein